MSQERRSSLSSKPPLRGQDVPKNRYSSPVMGNNGSSSSIRHYATPEESDAVLPVFNTPTQMYIKQELNQRFATPSPKQQYASTSAASSPAQQQHYSGSQAQQAFTQQSKTYTPPTTNGYANTKPPGSPLV
jgi:hypothetical protein